MSVYGEQRLSRCSQLDALIPITNPNEVKDGSSHGISHALNHTSSQSPRKPRSAYPLGAWDGFAAPSSEETRHERPDQPPPDISSGGASLSRRVCSYTSLPHSSPAAIVAPQTPNHSSPTPSTTASISQSEPQAIPRPSSPYSDKEATPQNHSYLSVSPQSSHTATFQADWSEKEVVTDSSPFSFEPHIYATGSSSLQLGSSDYLPSPAYPDSSSIFSTSPISSASASDSASLFGQPLAYTNTTLAFTECTPSDFNMKYFRRRPQSQALAPSIAAPTASATQDTTSQSNAPLGDNFNSMPSLTSQLSRGESISTMNEKRSLGPQDTGVVHANGEVGFGFGVQDDDKQPVQPYDHSISGQITLARTTRVRAVVDAYIEPILRQQAANGMAQTTLVLVPEVAVNPDSVTDYNASADPFDLDSKAGGEVKKLESDICRLLTRQEAASLLIGFPAEQSLRVVRLAPAHSGHTGYSGDDRARFGDEGSRFWQQAPVVTELDRLLRIRLVDMGLDVQDPSGITAAHRKAGWTERGENVGASLPAVADLGRRIKLEREKATGFGDSPQKWNGKEWEAGVGIWSSSGVGREQASWQVKPQQRLLPGQASVAVRMEDVCFRTENAMGLFDTKTDQAVVVSVRIEV